MFFLSTTAIEEISFKLKSPVTCAAHNQIIVSIKSLIEGFSQIPLEITEPNVFGE